MTQAASLWLFFVLVFGVVILPGLDMAFVLGSTLQGGRRQGAAAVAGIVAGGMCHVTMTALGISVLLKLVPGAFDVLLGAGALYVAWIGVSMLRSRTPDAGVAAAAPTPRHATFRRGALTNLLNPKAYLFMLAVFPQFVRPQYGPLWRQAIVLWVIIAVTQVGIYGGVALAADRVRHGLAGRAHVRAWATRCVGAVLVAAAVLTATEAWWRGRG